MLRAIADFGAQELNKTTGVATQESVPPSVVLKSRRPARMLIGSCASVALLAARCVRDDQDCTAGFARNRLHPRQHFSGVIVTIFTTPMEPSPGIDDKQHPPRRECSHMSLPG